MGSLTGSNKTDFMIGVVFLLVGGLTLFAFVKFLNYIGISPSNDDDALNFLALCGGFISILLAVRVVDVIFFRKVDGEWTSAGKGCWRYCLIGAITVVLISIPVEYLNISKDLKYLLEMIIIIVVALYFYIKYYEKRKLIEAILVEIGQKITSEKNTAPVSIEKIIEEVIKEVPTKAGVAIKNAILDLITEGKEIGPVWPYDYNPRISTVRLK